uniref:Uncharacterized protein n=1 Tax=Mus musculus TaxID=10090 RepID=Q3V3J7_MOUSE|nr:unnamed protein product [Mus musculus]
MSPSPAGLRLADGPYLAPGSLSGATCRGQHHRACSRGIEAQRTGQGPEWPLRCPQRPSPQPANQQGALPEG